MFKKFIHLLWKRGMGTGVGGINLEGRGGRFQHRAVCQCCKQKSAEFLDSSRGKEC
jgi:hypothetical protein